MLILKREKGCLHDKITVVMYASIMILCYTNVRMF